MLRKMSSSFFNLKSDRTTPMRKGKGIGSSKGKTAGKGHKGQKARSGKYNLQLAYYGSQTPQVRLLPKRGFTSMTDTFSTVKISEILYMLASNIILTDSEISAETFVNLGVIKKGKKIKVIASSGINSIDSKLNFGSGVVLSASVKNMVELAGGSVK